MSFVLDSWLSKTQKYFGIIEICGHHFYERELNSQSKIVDLGANEGTFSISLLKKYNCSCHAVEASPVIYNQIPNLKKLFKYNYAIGAEEGEIDFFIREDSEASSARFVPEVDCEKHRIRQVTLKKLTEDNQIIPIDLLKVDIEGSEIELFQSMPDDLFKEIKQITIEYHDFIRCLDINVEVSRIRKRLKKLGYREYLFSPLFHMDCLYIHQDLCQMPLQTRIAFRCFDIITRLRKQRFKWLSRLGIKKIDEV